MTGYECSSGQPDAGGLDLEALRLAAQAQQSRQHCRVAGHPPQSMLPRLSQYCLYACMEPDLIFVSLLCQLVEQIDKHAGY